MISIVTIAFNDLRGLQRTSESVLGQSTSDYQWIVVDGGSTDGSVEFLSSLGGQCEFRSEPDKGIYDAMRRGLDRCSQKHVIFLNSGDCFADADSLLMAANSIGSSDVYFFDTRIEGAGTPYLRRARGLRAARYSVPAVQQSTIYDVSVLQGLTWPTDYRVCGDFYIAAQLYRQRCSWEQIHETLSVFQLGGVSTFSLVALCREAWRVQREVLNLPLPVRALHFIRRLVTTSIVLSAHKLAIRRSMNTVQGGSGSQVL